MASEARAEPPGESTRRTTPRTHGLLRTAFMVAAKVSAPSAEADDSPAKECMRVHVLHPTHVHLRMRRASAVRIKTHFRTRVDLAAGTHKSNKRSW